ncbi:MAG: methyl-accepting chemotaxis protein [Dissulfurispiraceae bacterium]|jgi:methyl-accepting chemotaxis protein
MRLDNISLRWKSALPIIFLVSVGVVFTVIFTGYKTKDMVLDEIRHSALEGYRDTILNSLTTMMIAGNYRDSRGQFLEQMQKIADIRVLRSKNLEKSLAETEDKGQNYVPDDIEREVVENGSEKIVVDGDSLRGVYPYTARSNFMGKNCLTCHQVREGDILGAISIKIPITQALARIRSLQYLYALLGLVGIGILTFLVVSIVNFTHKPLLNFMKELKEIGSRYSGLDVTYERGDEVSAVAKNVTMVISHLNSMINNIMVETSKIIPVIDKLKGMITSTTKGARSQSGQAVQIAAAAEQMRQTIDDIARNASVVAETSSGALDLASGGREVADSAVEKVKEVHKSTLELSNMIVQLNSRVEEIGDIASVIKSIADQTNLLALNAAIEAARAGDQGRGFAVVADEVRKLAERTIKATDEISSRIEAVQTESGRTASFMGEATEKSASTAQNIGRVGESLYSVLAEVRKVKDEITKVAAAVDQQSTSTGEIAKHIGDTSIIAQDVEKMSDNAFGEIMKLTEVTDGFRAITAGVKTMGGAIVMLELAKSDHKGFVGKIGSCLRGEVSLDPSNLADHHTCRFGKWYYKEGHELCGHAPDFKSVEPPHEKIHQLAKSAVEAHRAGDRARAEQLYQEMEPVSRRIIDMIDSIKNTCSEGVVR